MGDLAKMKKIYFITSNDRKVSSLKRLIEHYDIDVEIESYNLGIIEPQADDVTEVSKIKALEAWEKLKFPVIVEDGGFEIEALNGFPGVYTRYILDTIGADGIIDLMRDKKNRKCSWVSCSTFIDENGNMTQFNRRGGQGLIAEEKSIVQSKFSWSEIWNIFYSSKMNKCLCELSKEELSSQWDDENEKSSQALFVEWFKSQYK